MFLKKLILSFLLLSFTTNNSFSAEKQEKLLTQNWSFNGFFGKFDRASLQRGYQVYTEVCASCHSMNLLSYRNLSEVGGPSFSEEEVKAIASKVEVLDGPNDNGEMFKRPGKPSDKFVSPFANEKAARAANGGAYPPDMSERFCKLFRRNRSNARATCKRCDDFFNLGFRTPFRS